MIGLARDSFGAEDLAVALADQPKKDDHTLIVQIHIALLSNLLAGGKEAEEEEEEGGSAVWRVPKEIVAKREKLKLAHEQLRKLPITHLTWFEVLRRFVELSRRSNEPHEEEEEAGDSKATGDNSTKDTTVASELRENEAVTAAVRELAEREYETLSLDHKLSLLEYLCYEVENTIAFRAHIREQVEVVEGLHKEKYAEELKLKRAKKVLEEELMEKKKMQAMMTNMEDDEKQESNQKSNDKTEKNKDNDKTSNKNNNRNNNNGSNTTSSPTTNKQKKNNDNGNDNESDNGGPNQQRQRQQNDSSTEYVLV